MPGTVVPLTMFIRKVPCTTNSHVSRTRTSSRKQLCLAGTWGRGEGWLVSCLQPSYKSWWFPFTQISLISSSFAKKSCDCIKRFWEGEGRRKRERWQQGSKSGRFASARFAQELHKPWSRGTQPGSWTTGRPPRPRASNLTFH